LKYQWDAWNYSVKFLVITKYLGAQIEVISDEADFSK